MLSESPDAQFIFDLKNKTTPQIAGCACAFLSNQFFDITTSAAIEGGYWALRYREGSTDTVEAQQKALESIKREWDIRFGEQQKEFRKHSDQWTSEISNLETRRKDLIKLGEEQLRTQDTKFRELFAKSEEKLKNIAHTYDEKLALQSSVKYWCDKRAHHQNVMWCLAFVTVIFFVTTVSVFIWKSHEFLQETATQIPLWKLSVLLAIFSFGAWITRLSAKIFISNLHLRTDADERVTMIQTYLALLREGSGPKENERQLILQTLFRPSTTGFIKENGLTGFYEAMSKTMNK